MAATHVELQVDAQSICGVASQVKPGPPVHREALSALRLCCRQREAIELLRVVGEDALKV